MSQSICQSIFTTPIKKKRFFLKLFFFVPHVFVNKNKKQTYKKNMNRRTRSRTRRRTRSGKEHCEINLDGVKRCEPLSQYEQRMNKTRSQKRQPTKSRGNEKSSRVLKNIVKQKNSRRNTDHRVAIAKRVDEWLLHEDRDVPLEKFSALRFSDTKAVQDKFSRGPKVIERDTIASNLKFDYIDDSSSDGDYSSTDGGGGV